MDAVSSSSLSLNVLSVTTQLGSKDGDQQPKKVVVLQEKLQTTHTHLIHSIIAADLYSVYKL